MWVSFDPLYLAAKLSGMEIIFLLISISLVVAIGFLAAFMWAVRDGQYEDDYTPSVRILLDDKDVGASPAASDQD